MLCIITIMIFIQLASVSLSLIKRNASRDDIDCPGDTISYNCTILTNSETPHLTWIVTIPGHMPLNFTYDSLSYMDFSDYLGMNISVSLIEFSYEYIESEIVLTVVDDVDLDGTELECSIAPDLDADIDSVYINTSGMFRIAQKQSCSYKLNILS